MDFLERIFTGQFKYREWLQATSCVPSPMPEVQSDIPYVGSLEEELEGERFLESDPEEYPFDVESQEGRYGQ
jgi:hypothetical protein